MSEVSWITTELAHLYPDADLRQGVDLNSNGQLDSYERIHDTNNNGQTGDASDWQVWLGQVRRRRVNPLWRTRLGGVFRWGRDFRADNPIHDVLAIESALFPRRAIRHVYRLLSSMLHLVQIVNDEDPLTPRQQLALIYRVIYHPHFGIERVSYDIMQLADGLSSRQLDCDTQSLIVLAIAHEMGWPVYGVIAPHHMFVRWDDGQGTRFNLEGLPTDTGMEIASHSEEVYRRNLGIPLTGSLSRIWLMNLSRSQLIGHAYARRAERHQREGRHQAALADRNRAYQYYPGLRTIDSYQYVDWLTDFTAGRNLPPTLF